MAYDSPLFIWTYIGRGAKPQDDVERARALHGVRLIDETLTNGVSLHVDDAVSQRWLSNQGGWSLRKAKPREQPTVEQNV